MVLIHKKKIESKEEKEARLHEEQGRAMGLQDEYQAKGFELVSWVQHNKGVVSGLIIFLFLLGGGFSAYIYYQQRQAEQASSAYLHALKGIEGLTRNAENAQKFQDAEKQLAEIAASHSHKGVGTLADLYAAHLALENNEAAVSRERYQNVVSALHKDSDLYPIALIGLAYALEREGKADESLKQFATLIDQKVSSGRDLALWEAARLSKDKNPEQAKIYLAQLLEEFPASLYESNAKRLKESL